MKIKKSVLLIHLRHIFLRHRDSGPVKVFVVFAFVALVAFALNARASHFYSDEQHWPRPTAPRGTELPIKIYDNVYSEWDGALKNEVSQWGKSSVISTRIYNQGGSITTRCLGHQGYITVCSKDWGDSGVLMYLIKFVVVDGTHFHISSAGISFNDYYLTDPEYVSGLTNDWTTLYDWRKHWMCYALGNSLGLVLQDTDNFNENLGSCMDSTYAPTGGNPATSANNWGFLDNTKPNAHDYEALSQLYRHADKAGTSVSRPTYPTSRDVRDVFGKGTSVEKDAKGRTTLYKRDLGGGFTEFTHVDYID